MSSIATNRDHGSCLMPSLDQATVASAMHAGIVSCPAEATVQEIARMMVTHQVHCLAVMSVVSDGLGARVWGLISDQDVMRAGVAGGTEATAAGLAHQSVISVRPTMPLREATEIMLSHGASHVIVIDPDQQLPIGVLSSLDVTRVVAWGESRSAGQRPKLSSGRRG